VSAGQASLAMLPERDDVDDDEPRVRVRPTGKVVVGPVDDPWRARRVAARLDDAVDDRALARGERLGTPRPA
jgi:hypothetical protein